MTKNHNPIDASTYQLIIRAFLDTLDKLITDSEKDLDLIESHHLEDTKVHGFALGKEHAYKTLMKRLLSDLEVAQVEADQFEGLDA
ncbi:MAG: hypothetical protein K2H85_08025 [Allobaculum sp.]|nr:hypothetical protein [Allobaculum sp.]